MTKQTSRVKYFTMQFRNSVAGLHGFLVILSKFTMQFCNSVAELHGFEKICHIPEKGMRQG